MKNGTNRAANLRAQAAERAGLIAKLGWAPEDMTSRDTRYAATTGELAAWARHVTDPCGTIVGVHLPCIRPDGHQGPHDSPAIARG